MSFIAQRQVKSSATDIADLDDGEAAITGDVFWPVVKLRDLRLAARIGGDITTTRLQHVASEAFLHVCDQLADWRAARQLEGVAALADVEAPVINGESARVYRFRRAVYSQARALILEGYRDVSTTQKGDKDADALDNQIGDLWRDVRFCVADIQSLPRIYSEMF